MGNSVHNYTKTEQDITDFDAMMQAKRIKKSTLREYIKMINTQRKINNLYAVLIIILILLVLHLSVKFSGTSTQVESHLDTVKINYLTLTRAEKDKNVVTTEFETTDGRIYNLIYETPNDDTSVDALSNIMNDWEDETKYINLDYDIITRIHYNALLDKVTTTKKVVINNSAAYVICND